MTARKKEKAASLREDLPVSKVRSLGSDHPEASIVRGDLAAVYMGAGKEEKAAALLEDLLADRARVLGFDHPDTFIT